MSTAKPLMEMPEWDALWAAQQKPDAGRALIFKYSPTCSISQRVERGYNAWLQTVPADTPLQIFKVNVINQRPIARKISADVGVQHESPQVYLLGPNGKVLWHQSHMEITPEALVKETGAGKAMEA